MKIPGYVNKRNILKKILVGQLFKKTIFERHYFSRQSKKILI